jgi:hypothetical protein
VVCWEDALAGEEVEINAAGLVTNDRASLVQGNIGNSGRDYADWVVLSAFREISYRSVWLHPIN